jgi:hypothetical protein
LPFTIFSEEHPIKTLMLAAKNKILLNFITTPIQPAPYKLNGNAIKIEQFTTTKFATK